MHQMKIKNSLHFYHHQDWMVYCDPGDDLDLFFVPAILHVPQLFVLIKPGFE
jgi:hypothetical protein